MKRNLMPLLGVAFVAAVVATGIFYGLLIPRLRGSASADNPKTAVLALRPLDRGTVLRAEDVRTVEFDAKSLPANAIPIPEQVVGLTLLEPVAQNQPITQAHLTRRGAAGGPALAIPSGRRAVSIHPVDSSGVVAMMRSGSRVDIQILDTRGTQTLRRMLEDVEVLSVTGVEQNGNRPVVTLLVQPADADRLSLADATLQVRLILRNPNDRSVDGARSVVPGTLMSAAPAGRP